jgi:hypothetical protein
MKKMFLLLLILRGVTSTTHAQCISGNCDNGYGSAIIKKKGGIRFTGQFINRKPNGEGIAEYPDGTRYKGSWLNGTMDGLGTLTLNDGTVLTGSWRNSRFMGNDPVFARENTLAQADNPMTRPNAPISSGISAPLQQQPNSPNRTEDIAIRSDIFMDNKEPSSHPSGSNLPNKVSSPASITSMSRVWALAVGVSNYESQTITPLKYPHSDAFRMYAFWKSPEGGSLDDKHSQVLVNDQATKQGIIDSMRQLFNQASPNDLVTFFYSGHGLKGAFLPTDYDGNNLRLFHSEVNDLLSTCPAQYKLVIADACNSGSYLASKSVKNNEVFYSTGQDVQDVFFRELNRASSGTAFILSSMADEESLEVSTLHQSIFSYFVVRGMKGEANVNGDEIITVQELFDYVYANVTSYAQKLGKVQTPVIKGNYDPNMPVAMIRR